MKFLLIAILFSAKFAHPLFAGTLEYCAFNLEGEIPPTMRWSAFMKLGFFRRPQLERWIFIMARSFNNSDIHKIPFPKEFSSDGAPMVMESKDCGDMMTGTVSIKGQTADLKFKFQQIRKISDIIYMHKNGKGMPQPVFETRVIESEGTMPLGEWTFFGGISDTSKIQTFLAIRIKN